jgi:predicted transcriptional regulator
MGATTRCDNPMCTCDPCVCDSCSCGAVRLGELERRVMDILWQDPERKLTVRDVVDALPEYAYTTLATILDRLVQKGLVRRRMKGRTVQFAALATRGAHTALLMHDALAADEDVDAALVRFAEMLSRSEAAVLRETLITLDPESLRPSP